MINFQFKIAALKEYQHTVKEVFFLLIQNGLHLQQLLVYHNYKSRITFLRIIILLAMTRGM